MNISTFIKQPVPQIQIILMLRVTKELREREMEGRESPSPIKKQTCLVTEFIIIAQKIHLKSISFLLPQPQALLTFSLSSNSHIMGRADTSAILAYGVIWKKSLK